MTHAHPTQPASPRPVIPVASIGLPPRDAGRDAARFAVDARGALFVWTLERTDLGYYGPGTYRFLQFHPADERVTRLPIPETEAFAPQVVPFSDGRLLVLEPRVDREEPRPNVTVYDAVGRHLASFRTGDAVQDAQVTAHGRIWVSYFDESRRQLDCFSATREPLVRYEQLRRVQELPALFDCYALNVPDDHDVWVYAYPEFPLVRLRDLAGAGHWDASAVPGARAFAVDGERVLFAGRYPSVDGYGEVVTGTVHHRLLYLLTLATGAVETLVPVYPRYPEEPFAASTVPIRFDRRACVGRGSRLYVSDGEDVHIFDLAAL